LWRWPCLLWYRETQLSVHGPGFYPKTNVARLPVRQGNSDICFRWDGMIEEAVEHLRLHGVEVETGPAETRSWWRRNQRLRSFTIEETTLGH
jgi:hypothetical protein